MLRNYILLMLVFLAYILPKSKAFYYQDSCNNYFEIKEFIDRNINTRIAGFLGEDIIPFTMDFNLNTISTYDPKYNPYNLTEYYNTIMYPSYNSMPMYNLTEAYKSSITSFMVSNLNGTTVASYGYHYPLYYRNISKNTCIVESFNGEHNITLPLLISGGSFTLGIVEYNVPCRKSVNIFSQLAMSIRTNTKISPRTVPYVFNVIFENTLDTVLVNAVIDSNSKQLSTNKIYEYDREWRSNKVLPYNSIQSQVILNPLSDHLRDMMVRSSVDRNVYEIFLVGLNGETIGSTGLLSDYMQGDEAKHINTINNCDGGIEVSDVEYDTSAGYYLQQVSLPLIDNDSRIIGSVTWGIGIPSIICATVINQVQYFQKIRNGISNEKLSNYILEELVYVSYDNRILDEISTYDMIGYPLEYILQVNSTWDSHSIKHTKISKILSIIIKEIGLGRIKDIYILGIDGVLLGSTTTENIIYYNGDSDYYTKTLNSCDGSLYYLDKGYYYRLSLPMISTGNVISGVIIYDIFKDSLPCTKKSESSLDLQSKLKSYLHGSPQLVNELSDILSRMEMNENLVKCSTQNTLYSKNKITLSNMTQEGNFNSTCKDIMNECKSKINEAAGEDIILYSFAADIRGQVFSYTGNPDHLKEIDKSNYTLFNNVFDDCGGHIFGTKLYKDGVFDFPHYDIGLPVINDKNRVVGVLKYSIRIPNHLNESVSTAFYSTFVSINSIQFGLCIYIMFVFTKHRNSRLIKASSFSFLITSLGGCMLCIIGTILMYTHPTEGSCTICLLRSSVLPMGLYILLTPLFIKSYRVYKIFEGILRDKKFNTKVIKNKALGKWVFILTMIQFCIFLYIPISDTTIYDEFVYYQGVKEYRIRRCMNPPAYLGATYVYGFVIMAFGLFVSMVSRKDPGIFNESQQILGTIILIFSYSLIVIPLNMMLSDKTIELMTLIAIGNTFLISIIMILLFGIKVKKILYGEHQNKIITAWSRTNTDPSNRGKISVKSNNYISSEKDILKSPPPAGSKKASIRPVRGNSGVIINVQNQ